MFTPSQKKFRAKRTDLKTAPWRYFNGFQEIANLRDTAEYHHFWTQYTGLKDSKGREIYEGDILDIGVEKPALVQWIDKYCSFCLKCELWASYHYFGEAVEPKHCTIIGNVFENPELL